GEHDLGALTAAGDDGLHLVRREGLRLVDDEILVRKAAAADVGERLDLDLAGLEKLGESSGLTPLAAAGGKKKLQIVEDGLHPGIQLFFDVAREIADVAPEGHDRAAHQKTRVGLILDRSLEAAGKREERFSGARFSDQ